MVLDGRAAEGQPPLGLEKQHRLGGLRVAILDGLGFVQDHIVKLPFQELFDAAAQRPVSGQHEMTSHGGVQVTVRRCD